MKKTQFARQIDSIGRLLIPVKLRNQLGINAGDILDIFLHEDDNGKYLCLKYSDSEIPEDEVEKAKKIL